MASASATFEYSGRCTRCRAHITAGLQFESEGDAQVAAPPIIGSYCECGGEQLTGVVNGAQAVPLTLRGDAG